MKKLLSRDPESIGGFELIGRLGAGGLGVVYLASRDGVSVALKVMRESLADDPTERERFRREIEILSGVDSPNVARIIDSGVDDETVWFATEYVNGPNLKEHFDAHGPLIEEQWWVFARGFLRGLADIHELGVIHRDVKPANVLLDNGVPKIIDFGISHMAEATSLTVTGVMTGSPAWFAPEQIDGEEITQAADLFAAGSVLTYAAIGKTPWGNPNTMTRAAALRIGHGEPDLDGLSDDQARVVRALIHPQPEQRRGFAHVEPSVEQGAEAPKESDTKKGYRSGGNLSKSGPVSTVSVAASVTILVVAAVAAAMTGFFGYTNSAGPGLTPEALADVQGWSPATETEVRTVRGIPEHVKQELSQAIQETTDSCRELSDTGEFACAELEAAEPLERTVSGEAPASIYDSEVTRPVFGEVECEETFEDALSKTAFERSVECEWAYIQEQTYYAAGSRSLEAPAVITCSGETGYCDWGGGRQFLVPYFVEECVNRGDLNPCGSVFTVDCAEGGAFYGYANAYSACLPREIPARGEEAATVRTEKYVTARIIASVQLGREEISDQVRTLIEPAR